MSESVVQVACWSTCYPHTTQYKYTRTTTLQVPSLTHAERGSAHLSTCTVILCCAPQVCCCSIRWSTRVRCAPLTLLVQLDFESNPKRFRRKSRKSTSSPLSLRTSCYCCSNSALEREHEDSGRGAAAGASLEGCALRHELHTYATAHSLLLITVSYWFEFTHDSEWWVM